jgi:hypothetical protein
MLGLKGGDGAAVPLPDEIEVTPVPSDEDVERVEVTF